jgi:hypothetical protein
MCGVNQGYGTGHMIINRVVTDFMKLKRLYQKSPNFEEAIKAGKQLRHLWFALRDCRGGDSELFFGELGNWADAVLSKQDRCFFT